MSTVNQFNVVGRLGVDPELSYTPSGTPKCVISVATDVGYGENKDTTWVRATAWGRSAETIEKYFAKGKLIFLTGEIRTYKYEKKGQTHYGWGLDVKSWSFIGGRDESFGEPEQAEIPAAPESWDQDFSDDDIPF